MKLSTRKAQDTLKVVSEIEAFVQQNKTKDVLAIRDELVKNEDFAEFRKTHEHTFNVASDPSSSFDLSFVKRLLELRCKVDDGLISEEEATQGFQVAMAENLENSFLQKKEKTI